MLSFLVEESWDNGVESYHLAGGEKTLNYAMKASGTFLETF